MAPFAGKNVEAPNRLLFVPKDDINYLVAPAVDIQLMEVSLALILHVIILSLAVVETLVPRGMELRKGVW